MVMHAYRKERPTLGLASSFELSLPPSERIISSPFNHSLHEKSFYSFCSIANTSALRKQTPQAALQPPITHQKARCGHAPLLGGMTQRSGQQYTHHLYQT
jgi:hypothetical protein